MRMNEHRRWQRAAMAAMAALMMSACAPSTSRFYTLMPPSQAKVAVPVGAAAFELRAVRVPGQVDLPQLVVREGVGEVRVAETHQWVAPLHDEVRSALSALLAARLGQADLYRVPQPEGLALTRITVELRRFDSVPGDHVGIDALWAIQPPGDAVLRTCSGSFRESVSRSGYDALVEAHQRALGRLADAIHAALTTPDC